MQFQKKRCVAMLLAGGQGSRLMVLTENTAKPAVPFGGKYRIIDFPLSNCINSKIDTVGILTQYQPLELNEYIGNGQPWGLNSSHGGVQVLPPYAKSTVYLVCYFLLIIAFSYFYSTIQFNPIEIANNLKKNGGFIPGFRPGKPTADFILKVINKITLFGALYLAIVAIMPILVGIIIGNSSLGIGGTSVIIVVGVALETVKALEAQMLMRHYKGFLE